MSNKYLGKYRNESTRAPWWDYSKNGAYFITICTKQREHFFGEIVAGEMHYTEIGNVAITEWIKTPKLRPNMNIELDAFVVMPNHVHMIVILGSRRDAMHGVPTIRGINKPMNKFAPQSENIASIFRGYKSAVTTYARKNNIIFAWQSRFHDHIIRNEQEFQRIREYIINNPKNWETDSLR